MMADERYLLCRVAHYPLAIRAQAMQRIWPAATPPADQLGRLQPADLRHLLGCDCAEPGVAIAIDTAEAIRVVIVDQIIKLAHLAEPDFTALPPVFGFAAQFFDAICEKKTDGGYALRLRQDLQWAAV
jgi:hypothetical protein